jgi:hypothetical protein
MYGDWVRWGKLVVHCVREELAIQGLYVQVPAGIVVFVARGERRGGGLVGGGRRMPSLL